MRKFTENDLEKYLNYVNEYVIDINDDGIKGRCHCCGKILNEVPLPDGPEKKVVCINCREWFEENYKMHVEEELH